MGVLEGLPAHGCGSGQWWHRRRKNLTVNKEASCAGEDFAHQ